MLSLRHVPIAGIGAAIGLVAAIQLTPTAEWGSDVASATPAAPTADGEEPIRGSAPEAWRAAARETSAAFGWTFGDRPEDELAIFQDRVVEGRDQPKRVKADVKVRPGDTLEAMLVSAGVDRRESHEVIQALKQQFDPRKLRAGQAVAFEFVETPRSEAPDDGPDDGEEVASEFVSMTFEPTSDRIVRVERDGTGRLNASTSERALQTETRLGSAAIDSSLYLAGEAAGIPDSILVNMIHAFQFDVDFQRDIRVGDSFDILYETLYDKETGVLVRYGDVLFASLTVNGKPIAIYRFDPKEGRAGYYDAEGKSVKKALLRTPVDGARISSGYGMRKHPILGYNKMHRGVDFAAPTGTPVYAAGSGKIVKIGRKGGYGKYIGLRHNPTYSTAYAHLSRYARGLKSGSRVRQGQIIGFVGSTGRSTGPHLHYEILKNGKQVNPRNVRFPSGKKLAGDELNRFLAMRDRLDRQVERDRAGIRMAQAREH